MMIRPCALLAVAALASLAGCGSKGTTEGDVPSKDAGASSASSSAGASSSSSSASSRSVDAGHSSSASTSRPDAARDSSAPAHDASTAGLGPYAASGPATVTTASFSVTSPSDTFTTTAYIPSGSGPFPVVILGSGFEQSGIAYAPYADRLGSWGVVTLLRDDPGALSTLTVTDLASDMAYLVTTWLASTNADTTSALRGKVDVTRVGLAGHSRGGQVALLAGENGAKGKVLGIFGLDPVDTATGGVEARTAIATIGVPLAFIGETTDGTGGVGGQPCAPAADNFLVLYQAAASPIVAITAVDADHTMFEDPNHCAFCSLCTAGTASKTVVLDTAVRYLTAFFARQLLGDTTVGTAFAGAGIQTDVSNGTVTVESK